MNLSNSIPSGRLQSDHVLLTILAYEMGSVAKCLHYASIREDREKLAYLAEARIELSDLLTTCRQLAEAHNWSLKSLLYDGEERFKERMNDARAVLASKKS